MKPVIAIVGRPNVGKSTLLNRLAGRKVAVVEDEPGVTRDRLFVDCRIGDWDVILVDTGGLEPTPEDELSRGAVDQAHLAVEEADLVLFVCDGREGLHPLDRAVADVLRKSAKQFVCLVNKLDPGTNRQAYEFHELGFDFTAISASHGTGFVLMAERVEAALADLGFTHAREDEPGRTGGEEDGAQQALKLCLLGRPNVGKSSLANQLVGQARQLVSEIAGTTRDAVDLPFQFGEHAYLLVDTPGVRRKTRISQRLERFSVLAALRSMERSDVVVVVIDGGEPFSDQDARLLRLAHDRGRALVLVANKADLWDAAARRDFLDRLSHGARFVRYATTVALSARTGKGVEKLLPAVRAAYAAAGAQVGTGDLNRLLEQAQERQQPPMVKGRRGKVFYATQTGSFPPSFTIFVNEPSRFPMHYRRFLEHRMRDRYPLAGTPIRLRFKAREGRRKKGKHR